MATYFIGDVHGCLVELKLLLSEIDYNPETDRLWFAGDLVNRGPDSLQTLRWIKNQPNVSTVLGNHDLHCLALYFGVLPKKKKHKLDDILQAEDCAELMEWLLQWPFYQYWPEDQLLLTHAGFYPGWSFRQLVEYGDELVAVLRKDPQSFFAHMYGDKPNYWREDLQGPDRYRFLVNAFTRMRYISHDYHLEFEAFQPPPHENKDFLPWFELLKPAQLEGVTAMFGHWAALRGEVFVPGIRALDGGCVWDGYLLAWCKETGQLTRVQKV